MSKRHLIGFSAVLIALLAFSGAAVFAQTEEPGTTEPPMVETGTATAVPPAVFTDGRINASINLGGLAIYCVDQNSNTQVSSFDNGGITVWGIGDQKYINLSAAQLRGNVEILQTPSVMEMQMTATPATTLIAPTEMLSATTEATALVLAQQPILLARATTPNGELGFFSLGNDEFALQGHDQNSTFFTYTWTGCSTGVLEHVTAPFLPELEATATVEFPAFETPEVTLAS